MTMSGRTIGVLILIYSVIVVLLLHRHDDFVFTFSLTLVYLYPPFITPRVSSLTKSLYQEKHSSSPKAWGSTARVEGACWRCGHHEAWPDRLHIMTHVIFPSARALFFLLGVQNDLLCFLF